MSAGSRDRTALFGRLGVLAAAALFSTGGAAIKAASISGWQVASFRAGIASLALFVLLPAARRWPTPRVLAVSAAHATTMILFVLSNKLTTAASTIFLQSTAPLYILLLSPWLLHEKVRRRDLVFIAILAVGLSCFFLGLDPASATAPRPLLGDGLALLSGLFWGLTVMGLRALGKRDGSAASATLWGNAIACLVCLPLALPVAAMGGKDLAVVLYLGIVQIAVAYVCLTSGLHHVTALEASLLLFLEPVLNPIWAWWVHGEQPSRWSLTGGAVILAATLVKTWRDSAGQPPPIPEGEPHGS